MELGSDVLRRLNSAPSRTFLPVHPQAAAIPKIIHQTFYTRAFPPLIEENLARIRRLNPEWSYRFYGDDDVVKSSARNVIQGYSPASSALVRDTVPRAPTCSGTW